ncbi:PHD finger protein 20 isoform X6 [Apis mellifera]|uniref:PHD finger protein 20 isoform X6 n=1 Tax=Apis mellifera TaxID=7460 RepID=A0A7M7GTI6_APIME|nr:PHD finger protein 20 isoform X6 [Apis mellifera]|eukprot:XP_006566203.1 PHD finger protein 20 isoform X6 [Apis mellifera]
MKRRRIARSHIKRILPIGTMRMARKCCVRSCEADVQDARAKGLPLHKFPKDITLRNKWLTSGGFDANFKPSPGQVVCHRHFKRADYEAAKGHKLLLRKGSVPSVFADYDNHPDPVIMSVKSSTSYAQEDLDLINSEILNLEQSISPLNSGARTPKSDSCGETCSSRPESSADSFNLLDSTELIDNGCKTLNMKEENISPMKHQEINKNSEIEVNTMAVQLGIVESDITMKHIQKDLVIKEELKNIKIEDEKTSEELKPKIFNRGGLKFFPGAKLEAKDFNEKWYSAKVVETDWDEREVLIRFDKWSSRFDEWIPMDSSRLRVLQTQSNEQTWNLPSLEAKMKDFSVGERILATWADGRKYPAKVNAVLGNDRYDVLFDDGYTKTIKSSKMTKIAATPTKQSSQTEEYIGSKQERRDKKRKHTVMELFHTHYRKRSKNETDKLTKKEGITVNENAEIFSENKIDLDGTLFGPCYDPGTDLLRGFDTNVSKLKAYSKKNKKEVSKNDIDLLEDVGPEWVDGEPQGTESYIVDGNDGPRRSIIVADKRLPPGWQKHFTQRKAGTSAGKWDVLFLHKSSGKKFRSKNDIRAFMENQGQFDFDPEKFDFCIHRKKKNQSQKIKQDIIVDAPKKIKTLLPKTKATPVTDNSLLVPTNTPVTTLVSTSTTSITDGGVIYSVFIGGLRVEMEDSAYKCPKEGCSKTFRKENLLQMHIKHYHPEYSKFLGCTPNVADLAYARTIGESVEDIIPKKSNNLIEKCNKFGKRKFIQDRSLYVSSPSVTNTIQPASPTVTIPMGAEIEDEIDQIEKCNDMQTEDIKIERMSPNSSHSLDMHDEIEKKREDTCAMSPGTLFDLKTKEEKTQSGIKTLLPIRPAVSSEAQRIDRSKSLDETIHIDKLKGQRKRQLSEYSSDISNKGKKRHGIQEFTDEYGDLDDSAMDLEGGIPTTLMYRYSRRKSDSRSDENSQSSQLNDSRIEKDDSLKGNIGKKDTNDGEDNDGVMMMINGEMVKVEQLRREEIINCTCGFMEEDGLMIQCDLCLCWQHGHCNAIEKEKDVPEKYVCFICRNPYRQRLSKRYFHDQDWIKEGKLPTLSNRTKNQHRVNERTAMLKRSYDLVAALLQIQQVLHSLRVKINVAQKKDHPKLYLWAKNWEKIEVLKPNMTPVPIMEIIKSGKDCIDTTNESSHRIEIKTETKFSLKDDHDEKSIASDSELMKILEEDNITSDESKNTGKKEDLVHQNKSHILLDALTKNDTIETKYKNSISSEIKANTANDMHEEENEMSTPLQPFIPQPEAPIDPGECRMRLLEHIEHFQKHIDAKLTYIEAEICALETMDPEDSSTSDVQPRTKQTVQMLVRDLNTVRKLAALC